MHTVDVLILTCIDIVVISYKSITVTWKVEHCRMLFLKVKSFVFIISLENVSIAVI